MSSILYIILALCILGFITVVHEFGHYIVGRLCGIGIVEFAVGFGPKLLSFTRKGIKYSLRLLPLGGFCAFVGEDGENPAPNAMNNMPVWKRFLTVASGPAMNFIVAFIFCVILLCNFMVAEYQPWIAEIYENTPAAVSELQEGDIVTHVNGAAISYDTAGMEEARSIILDSAEQEIILSIEREGEAREIAITPAPVVDEASGETYYQLGIAFGSRGYTFGEAVKGSFGYMVDFTRAIGLALKDLVFHGTGADDVMGPVGIISFVSDTISTSRWYGFVYLVFFLSLNLGFMNLLPLPGLDGGRLIFLIVEGIRRKPVPPEKEGMVHALGLTLLFALVIFITYKDIIRLITGG